MRAIVALTRWQRAEKRKQVYADKGRLIDSTTYTTLKSLKRCQACKKPCKVEIHHKVPVSKGGSNEKENLIALCKKCHILADKLNDSGRH